MDQICLDIRGLTKAYGGTLALADVDFQVAKGEIHGLCGENGAGKSTLVRQVSGIESPDAGKIRLFGQLLTGHFNALDIAKHGCVFVHQQLALIGDMSIAENIALTAGFITRSGFIDRTANRRRAEKALERLGVNLNVDQMVNELPIALQAIVAIARAVVLEARLIILDEPTAALQKDQAQVLFLLLGRLREQEVSCLLISHRMDEILEWCDRVTVLRSGRHVITASVSTLDKKSLIRHMLGCDPDELPEVGPTESKNTVLVARNICTERAGPISFEIQKGEILGVTGSADSGHLELAAVLFGLNKVVEGSITLEGGKYQPQTPAGAISAGVFLVPADRAAEGIAAEMNARENIGMNTRKNWNQWINLKKECENTRELLENYDVRPPDPERQLVTFSGGNQQKIVLAKWMKSSPLLLILCEPTGGVDAGAKLQIYRKLHIACGELGASILVASSDFEEISTLCTRVIVMRHGKIFRTLNRGVDLTLETVTKAVFTDPKNK